MVLSNSHREQTQGIPQFNYQNDQYNAPGNYNQLGLPPRSALIKKKPCRKNLHGSKMRPGAGGGGRMPSRPGWDDSFARKEDNKIPEYFAVKDHYA